MPYIRQDVRPAILQHVKSLANEVVTVGQLNYAITELLLSQGPSTYDEFNELVGVLECCKLEFYRRAVAAYEDQKRRDNGDVYF